MTSIFENVAEVVTTNNYITVSQLEYIGFRGTQVLVY